MYVPVIKNTSKFNLKCLFMLIIKYLKCYSNKYLNNNIEHTYVPCIHKIKTTLVKLNPNSQGRKFVIFHCNNFDFMNTTFKTPLIAGT